MSESTCIYCRRTEKGRFPKEHVIPEAFGKFKNNFTLDCVCAECNSYFGEELELFLARDSGEALLRLRYGLKPVSEARELRNIRIQLRINEPGFWFGARFVQTPDETGTKLQPELLPQVGFRKKENSDWIWLTEDQLHDPEVVEPYRKDVEIRITGPSNEAVERVRQRLAELGINFKQQGILDQPVTDTGTVQAELLYQIDQVIFRGIGKIAFNYVAYVQEATFALRPDFDEIRQYLRYSHHPGWVPVVATKMPILADDTANCRQTNGHLIVFDWNQNSEGLIAQVSLFNNITYHVLLCRKYSGLWYNLRSGHHFDIETHTISKVFGVSLAR